MAFDNIFFLFLKYGLTKYRAYTLRMFLVHMECRYVTSKAEENKLYATHTCNFFHYFYSILQSFFIR